MGIMYMLAIAVATPCAAVVAVVAAVVLLLRLRRIGLLRSGGRRVVGVFHPYCNAGGGGERVLWVALQAMERRIAPTSPLAVHIYTGDTDAPPSAILAKAKGRFFVDLSGGSTGINFVYIMSRGLLEAARYPRFTMLLQSLASIMVATECLWRQPCHVFMDTTGCAFTYFVAKAAGCCVASYTHYPTITQDMLKRVHDRRPTYNNDSTIANSVTLTAGKLWYYRAFAAVYALAGRFTDANMVNSNWTRQHIQNLWSAGVPPVVVFPPCNTTELQTARLGHRKRVVVSVGQFRPEKDHPRQLAAFAALKAMGTEFDDVSLLLIGGARGTDDQARVDALRAQAEALGIQSSVQFLVNAPFQQLKDALATSLLGIHTMWNEHFGIGVVEMMAAGVVPVAHATGGPKTDIVVPVNGQRTGYLADTPQQYADAMATVLRQTRTAPDVLAAQVARARRHAGRFSDEEFSAGFVAAVQRLFPPPAHAKRD